jgi:hypothetical protein
VRQIEPAGKLPDRCAEVKPGALIDAPVWLSVVSPICFPDIITSFVRVSVRPYHGDATAQERTLAVAGNDASRHHSRFSVIEASSLLGIENRVWISNLSAG